ncbi:MAG: outer membrane lipoprotein-sorting protein [SAR324 cluster bacterium]|nr:outer membrane lipoprotein-sorting protein [SAR324 cluster bacterium]
MYKWFIVIVAGFITTQAYGQTAHEIISKVRDREIGNATKTRMTMVLIEKDKTQRVRELISFSKSDESQSKDLLYFESPPDMKGTGFLNIRVREKNGEKDQWLYLPALKKVKRIASSESGGDFLGSDFSYSDMGGTDIDNYNYALKGEEKVNGYDTYQIISQPKTDAIAKQFGYRKSILWVAKDIWLVVKAINYTTKPGEIKLMEASDIKEVNGIWTAYKIQMSRLQEKAFQHATIMVLNEVEYNSDIDDGIFTERQLMKGF